MTERFWGVTAKGTLTRFTKGCMEGEEFFTFTMDGGRHMTTRCFTVE